MRFRLVQGADDQAFRAADRRVQTKFAYRQPGLQCLPWPGPGTASGSSSTCGEASRTPNAVLKRWEDDAATLAFMTFVDTGSVSVSRYDTLE